MKLYKLTDQNGKTRAECENALQWGESITRTAVGSDADLCTDGVIHAYESPLVAAFMNPAHANFGDPILWEAEGEIVVREGQLKCGVKTLTTIRRIDLPVLTTEQRVEIAIRCAMAVCNEPTWRTWAENWLNGTDRSEAAAEAATEAAADAAADAAEAATEAAADAAWTSAEAATEAAADAAETAAEAAARAAWTAAAETRRMELDLHGIIESVVAKKGA